MEVSFNFGGFYGYFDEDIEQKVLDYQINEDKVDWDKTRINFCKAWIDKFNNEFDLSLGFVGIDSPRFYNFRNDELIVDLYEQDEIRLMNHSDDLQFRKYANKRLTSCDGYVSYYVDYKELCERASTNEDDYINQLSLILEYLVWSYDFNSEVYDLEYEIEVV